MKYTDPSGFFYDWFINEETGDVYYNSSYKKGDEKKIKGEGWVWFGENNFFTKFDPFNTDFNVLMTNCILIDGYKQFNETYSGPIVRNDSKLTGFNIEASLKGKNALTFMKNRGMN